MRGEKGQVSVEYMLVLGMALLLLLPGAYLFYNFSQGTSDQISTARITRAGNEIIGSVEQMYAVGQNSWTTLTLNLPEDVINIYVAGEKELVFQYETQNGLSEAVFFSRVNMTGLPGYDGNISQDFKPGNTKVKISSKGSQVEVREHLQ